MKTFFIHYTFCENGIQGDGNVDVTVSRGIDDIHDIRELEAGLKEKHGFETVVITNYIQFIGS